MTYNIGYYLSKKNVIYKYLIKKIYIYGTLYVLIQYKIIND